MTIDEIKARIVPVAKPYGVVRLGVFGSAARGELTAESDIDILVDMPRGTSLFDMAEMQAKFEVALGGKADVVTYNALHHRLRDRVLAEQVQLL